MKRLIVTVEAEGDDTFLEALDYAKKLIGQGYTEGDLSNEDASGTFEIEELEDE